MRQWLRRLLGWGELEGRLDAQAALIEAMSRDLAVLEERTRQQLAKETRPRTRFDDWETIQAAYAANPENFKEN